MGAETRDKLAKGEFPYCSIVGASRPSLLARTGSALRDILDFDPTMEGEADSEEVEHGVESGWLERGSSDKGSSSNCVRQGLSGNFGTARGTLEVGWLTVCSELPRRKGESL